MSSPDSLKAPIASFLVQPVFHNHIDVSWGGAFLVGGFTFVLFLLFTLFALLCWLLFNLVFMSMFMFILMSSASSMSSLMFGELLSFMCLESLLRIINFDFSEAYE